MMEIKGQVAAGTALPTVDNLVVLATVFVVKIDDILKGLGLSVLTFFVSMALTVFWISGTIAERRTDAITEYHT